MRKTLTALSLAIPLAAAAANPVLNGSFEFGTVGEPGSDWVLTEGVHTNSPRQIQYFPTHVGGAFGESVPMDNAPSMSPDLAGEHGIYFVDDTALQTLTSTSFTVATTGLYSFGFSSYAPANGLLNTGNSSYSLALGSATLFGTVAGLLPTTWQAQSGLVSLTAGQNYSLLFNFAGGGPGGANDIVTDRFYVSAVPESGTLALMLAGLGTVASLSWRRRAP